MDEAVPRSSSVDHTRPPREVARRPTIAIAEIREAVTDGAAQIAAQEQKVAAAAERFASSKRPTAAQLRRFRAAPREEEAVVRSLRGRLLGLTPDTEPVGRGRTLIAQGLQRVATGLDRTEKALGRLQHGGSAKANARSIAKAQKLIVRGNELIEPGEPGEPGEPLVGAEGTPNAPAPAPASAS